MTKKAKSDEDHKIHSKISVDEISKEVQKEISITDEDNGTENVSTEKLKKAEAKADEYLDQLQRLQAEFSNYRKRMDRERQSLKDWLHGEMILELLPVLDDLDRLLQSHENQNTVDQNTIDQQPIDQRQIDQKLINQKAIDQKLINQKPIDINGVKLIQQKLQKILRDKGLQEIESVGQVFNPDLHEAIGVEHTEEEKAGRVLEEWEKGYKIGEKLLRPSRVKVGKFDGKAGDESK